MDLINYADISEYGVIVGMVIGVILWLIFGDFKPSGSSIVQGFKEHLVRSQCEQFVVLGICQYVDQHRDVKQWSVLKPAIIEYHRRSATMPDRHSSIKQIRFQIMSVCSEMKIHQSLHLIDDLIAHITDVLVEHQLDATMQINCHRVFKKIMLQLRWVN